MEKCIIKNNNNLVGEIIRDGEKYTFKRTGTEYCDGFMWKDNNGNYLNEATIDHPFAIMQSRVPDKTNPRITEWMKKYGMGKYDVWELLKLSNGKMLGDKIEFIFENNKYRNLV